MQKDRKTCIRPDKNTAADTETGNYIYSNMENTVTKRHKHTYKWEEEGKNEEGGDIYFF